MTKEMVVDREQMEQAGIEKGKEEGIRMVASSLVDDQSGSRMMRTAHVCTVSLSLHSSIVAIIAGIAACCYVTSVPPP